MPDWLYRNWSPITVSEREYASMSCQSCNVVWIQPPVHRHFAKHANILELFGVLSCPTVLYSCTSQPFCTRNLKRVKAKCEEWCYWCWLMVVEVIPKQAVPAGTPQIQYHLCSVPLSLWVEEVQWRSCSCAWLSVFCYCIFSLIFFYC